jgi:hypothetical protein
VQLATTILVMVYDGPLVMASQEILVLCILQVPAAALREGVSTRATLLEAEAGVPSYKDMYVPVWPARELVCLTLF